MRNARISGTLRYTFNQESQLIQAYSSHWEATRKPLWLNDPAFTTEEIPSDNPTAMLA